MTRLLLIGTLLLTATSARAHSVEPGAIRVGAGIGPGITIGSELDGSSAAFFVDIQGEYAFNESLGLLANFGFGIAATVPLRFRLGVRYRVTDLDLPLSPFAQLQLSIARLFNVVGANLTVVGVRMGFGVDYFLSKQWSLGATATVDLGGTTKKSAVFSGSFEFIVYVGFQF